ncbi:RCC1 and BTB domain-containing protein 2-like [Oppia nitens]|uniref:RCC1 and BTB domain-containing protein 2-like n=1 Tax=Oppia nitens TaxID=1686743 RepID=UPI0023D9C9B8|nr:RCC1 and BTB domain-containing protein 2-like [Oppia nitens]
MNDLLTKFLLCNKIPETIKLDIKLLHCTGNNVWFVTSADQCYVLGDNMCGELGLGHKLPVNEPQVVRELCSIECQKFIIGTDFGLCLTSDQQIYSWGSDSYKQLGRHTCHMYSKPANIPFLSDKSITDIASGFLHSLALTSDGRVYGWGDNRWGQVGCGQRLDRIRRPSCLIFPPNTCIKSISCINWCSLAITADGLVYCGGWTKHKQFRDKTRLNFHLLALIPNISDIKSLSIVYLDMA